jgi:hypothetical protein
VPGSPVGATPITAALSKIFKSEKLGCSMRPPTPGATALKSKRNSTYETRLPILRTRRGVKTTLNCDARRSGYEPLPKRPQLVRPDEWTDRPVKLVFISGSSTEYIDGVLEEVNDRGIVLSVELHVGRPVQSLFYPWSAIVQLSEAQENK